MPTSAYYLLAIFATTTYARNVILPKDNGKIIGGFVAADNQFPAIVSLRKYPEMSHFCAGTIIDEIWIVTAAHCLVFPKGQIRIVAGSNKLQNNTKQVVRAIADIIPHELYKKDTLRHDIGLLKLSKPLNIVKNNLKKLQSANVKAGEKVIVAGWGYYEVNNPVVSPDLKFTNLTTITNQECNSMLKALRNLKTESYQICTGGEENNGDCQGDSGGPLMNYGGDLVGLVSWGPECADKESPNVYTKVHNFKSWIKEKTSIKWK